MPVVLTELIISDITRMDPGLCVIGLEGHADGYRSVRPAPPRGHAWPATFDHHRGDRLRFRLSSKEVAPPHLEDRASTGVLGRSGSVTEEELLSRLHRAELAGNLHELFGCPVRVQRKGAFIWPTRAVRSICGVSHPRVRLKMEGREIRAAVGLSSGESLPDLPLVDRSWFTLAETALAQMEGANRVQRLNRFFADVLLRAGPEHLFVRIGVTRPRLRRCWLMVDSLFPMPRRSWLAELAGNGTPLEKEP